MDDENNAEENSKEDSVIRCPNCEEENMRWDVLKQMWQCLSCGHRIKE
jgi:uncharacterized protein (DUF983 family)